MAAPDDYTKASAEDVSAGKMCGTCQSFADGGEGAGRCERFGHRADAGFICGSYEMGREGEGDEAEADEMSRLQALLDLRLPDLVIDALRQGLAWHDAGFGSRTLSNDTIRAARAGVSTGVWSADRWAKAAGWLAGNKRHLRPGSFEPIQPRPAGVSHALWGTLGDNRGAEYIRLKAAQLKAGNELSRDITDSEAARLTGIKDFHNSQFGDEPTKRVAHGVLREAWQRGGPTRVGALLHLLRTGKPPHGVQLMDLDLVPEGHPAHELSWVCTDDECAYMLAGPGQELGDDIPLHILRVGPIHDLDTGTLILDVTEGLAREIASTSQALIDAGVVIPISMEHGIERAGRGDTTGDVRPYGQLLGIWYDEERRGVYASKEWSALGLSMVSASQTPGGSALRISPRVKVKPAYHPQTAEVLGLASIDTASLTTLPRQDSVEAVPLARDLSSPNTEQVFTSETKNDKIRTSEGNTAQDVQIENGPARPKGQTMTNENQKAEQASDAMLSRGSSEANAILGFLGLGADADADELSRAVEGLQGQLAEAVIELSRYRAEKAEAALQLRTAEANELLDRHDIDNKAERGLYLSAMLADDPAQVEMARGALTQRGSPDNQGKINEAIELAKGRGALPADFTLEDSDLAEKADTVIAVLSRIPDGVTVRIGDPEGSTTAGLDGDLGEMDREAAGDELSRLTRLYHKEHGNVTRLQALNITKAAHPELVQAAFNQVKG